MRYAALWGRCIRFEPAVFKETRGLNTADHNQETTLGYISRYDALFYTTPLA